jgi:hypothetical protein
VFWSWDEQWAGRVVTVLSVDLRFEIWDLRFEIWDLRFEIYSTDESGSLNKELKFWTDGDSCRSQVSVFGRVKAENKQQRILYQFINRM